MEAGFRSALVWLVLPLLLTGGATFVGNGPREFETIGAALARSETERSDPPEGTQQKKTESHRPNGSSDAQQTNTQQPTGRRGSMSFAQDHQPDGGNPAAQKEGNSSAEWWIARATIVLAFVTAVLAFFTLKLWRSTSDLVKETAHTAKQ